MEKQAVDASLLLCQQEENVDKDSTTQIPHPKPDSENGESWDPFFKLTSLLGLASTATAKQAAPKNSTTSTRETTYDYIVAGAGASGLVVADAGHSVLLIERGGRSFYETGNRQDLMEWNETVTMYDVPGMAFHTDTSPTIQWCQDIAASAPRAADFQKWPQGWHWEDGVADAAQSLFKRMPGEILASANGKRYDDGAFEVMSCFLDSNGWDKVDALNDAEAKEGVYTHPPWLISNGLRGGPVRDILPDAQALSSFNLELNAMVVRAVRNGPVITGVEIQHDDGSREIINLEKGGSLVLSSGAHSTPRVLFNSGIGPVDQLEIVASGSTNVQLPPKSEWIELPVGQNLRDHPIVLVQLTVKEGLEALPKTAWTDPDQEPIDLFAQGSGLVAQSGQRLNFWKSVECSDGVTRYVQGTVNAPSNDTLEAKVYLTHGLTSVGTLEITPEDTKGFASVDSPGDRNRQIPADTNRKPGPGSRKTRTASSGRVPSPS
ncbi:hypothetical protein FZEAL_4537 [Fusarium zealandicum]|uniref:Glucose-methanol-choline oxidoreductase N-terminal domain-containing protein n=1 Tax=Fusarium zealandicum TaxID=1053134 RepID=A0A8H4UM09_9HYPO|nr:hypothetical protein FZEAL_4537 [Fusarium zealandicum]